MTKPSQAPLQTVDDALEDELDSGAALDCACATSDVMPKSASDEILEASLAASLEVAGSKFNF